MILLFTTFVPAFLPEKRKLLLEKNCKFSLLCENFLLPPLPRELFFYSFLVFSMKTTKWHDDWGHILSCLIHVLHNTFYNNKKKAHAIIMKAKRGGGRRIETWKTHVLNKNKCVYIMQRFVIKNFNVMLQHFFAKIFKYYHTDGFPPLSLSLTLSFSPSTPPLISYSGLHSGFLLSTILDGSTFSV